VAARRAEDRTTVRPPPGHSPSGPAHRVPDPASMLTTTSTCPTGAAWRPRLTYPGE